MLLLNNTCTCHMFPEGFLQYWI